MGQPTRPDLFLVGLVFDISGAVLLAKGLLLSPRTLSKLNTYWGLSHGQPQDRVDNRVAGEFGVTYLVLGFALQFVGYSLNIGGVSTKSGSVRLLGALRDGCHRAGSGRGRLAVLRSSAHGLAEGDDRAGRARSLPGDRRRRGVRQGRGGLRVRRGALVQRPSSRPLTSSPGSTPRPFASFWIGQPRLAAAALDPADAGQVDAGGVGEAVLRETFPSRYLPHPVAESPAGALWVFVDRLGHRGSVAAPGRSDQSVTAWSLVAESALVL
jgi:hypothetical protein